jgi:NADPH2:quinone reductase
VNYREEGWVEEIDAVDLAFDGVGGAIGRASFDLVRDGGRFFPFGMASGTFVEIPEDEAARRRVTIVRIAPPTPEEAVELTRAALADAAAGRLRPVIGQTFPLEDAAGAHAAIESRATTGKTLLVVRNA